MTLTGAIALRLLAAAALGGLVGIERERRHTWTAGLRTHMLVSVGSCLFMLTSAYGFADVLDHDHVALDPSRIAAQVASGIGFLGAGAILLRKDFIRGLTTAASIWTVAAIGLACGGGLLGPAAATTALALLILAGIRPLEERFFRHGHAHHVVVRTAGGTEALPELRRAAQAHRLVLIDFKMRQDGDDAATRFDLTLQGDLPQLLDWAQALKSAASPERPMSIEAISGRIATRELK
ncbi:MAG: MgtC/SapB family protein [Lautropia sp.]